MPECSLRLPRCRWSGLARGNEQPAHSDIAVRDIGHRHKSMAAGVDGGIALVIRHGVDTQHGHGTRCRGSTVDVGRGLAAGLLKDIRPAKVGGKAFTSRRKASRPVRSVTVLSSFAAGWAGFASCAKAGRQRQRVRASTANRVRSVFSWERPPLFDEML